MGDEDVAGDLTDVLQEGQVHVVVLQPGQLQIAIHVGAVGVPVPEIAEMMLPIVGHGHPAVRSDAYCKAKKTKINIYFWFPKFRRFVDKNYFVFSVSRMLTQRSLKSLTKIIDYRKIFLIKIRRKRLVTLK